MWRGNIAGLIKLTGTNFLKMSIYEWIKHVTLYKGEHAHKGWDLYRRKGLIAFVSSTFINVFLYPLERVKVIMELDNSSKKEKRPNPTIFSNVVQILKNDGFLGLYRGFWLTNFASFPYVVSTLMMYDQLREPIIQSPSFSDDINYRYLSLGLTTQQLSQIMLYPLDTVKKNQQADSKIQLSKRAYTGTLSCAKRLIKEDGIISLYKGFGVNICKNIGLLVIQYPMFIALKNSTSESFAYL